MMALLDELKSDLSVSASFGGFALDGVEGISLDMRKDLSAESLPSAHGGAASSSGHRESASLLIRATTFQSSQVALRDYFADLDNVANNRANGKVVINSDGRYVPCVIIAWRKILDYERTPFFIARYEISLESSDPYWYKANENVHTPLLNVTPLNFNVTNEGAASTPMRVEYTALGGDRGPFTLIHIDTGEIFRYVGTVREDRTLCANGRTRGVTVGSVDHPENVRGRVFDLQPGLNRLRAIAEFPATLSVNFTERD